MERKYGTKDIVLLPFKITPLWTSLAGLTTLINGVMATAQIYITAQFIDKALAVVGGNAALSSIYPITMLLVLTLSYFWISKSLTTLFSTKIENTLRENFRTDITRKRATLAYKHIENPETWDLIGRVTDMPEVKVKDAYYQLLSFLSLIIKIIGVLALLIVEVWWIPFVIIAFSVPLFAMAIKAGKANYDAYQEVTKYKRRREYIGQVLSHRDMVEERTLFGYGDYLIEEWHREFEKGRKYEYKVDLKWYFKMTLGSVLTALVSILSAVVMIGSVLQGNMSIGIFMALVNGIFSLVQAMSWQLTESLQRLAKHKAYLEDLTRFYALEESEYALDKPLLSEEAIKHIEFKNVTFSYPGTETKILEELSFKLEEGSHYAVVGANGSGKTTLTKLLTGLYTEYEGQILINGRDIKSYTQAELKGLFGVVYQDFAKYEISLEDNIALGNVLETKEELAVAIDEVVEQLDLKEVVDKLPQGLKTPLGKIKGGGQDLSGGQWQRLAMARTIIKDVPMYILDEPTAALDPISESRLYEEFGKMSQSKMTLFISHRLGSVQLADKILVIGKGKVIEEGTHEDLMALQGNYANMYDSQRSWYQ